MGPDFSDINIQQFARNIIEQDLTPLLHMVTDIAFFIGLCLIIVGMSRLHRHGQGQQMMYRVSPMGTAMCFLSGVVLISFMPHLQILSNSIFNANTVLMERCTGTGTSFYTQSNNFCPMQAYDTDIQNLPTDELVSGTIKYLAFATLVFVGVISFIRGMVQLVRIGDGQGQGSVGKALSHIFAGVVAVNADNVYALFQNILNSAGKT